MVLPAKNVNIKPPRKFLPLRYVYNTCSKGHSLVIVVSSLCMGSTSKLVVIMCVCVLCGLELTVYNFALQLWILVESLKSSPLSYTHMYSLFFIQVLLHQKEVMWKNSYYSNSTLKVSF